MTRIAKSRTRWTLISFGNIYLVPLVLDTRMQYMTIFWQ